MNLPKIREKATGQVYLRLGIAIDKTAAREGNLMVVFRREESVEGVLYACDSVEFLDRFEQAPDV